MILILGSILGPTYHPPVKPLTTSFTARTCLPKPNTLFSPELATPSPSAFWPGLAISRPAKPCTTPRVSQSPRALDGSSMRT